MSVVLSILLATAQATQPVQSSPPVPPAQPGQAALTVSDMAWLSGVWLSRRTDGQWADEYWTLPRGGMMLGAGMAGRNDTVQFFEHMRIVTDKEGRINFFAMSNGGPAVVFPLVRLEANLIVFENPKHDYPQRIVYQYADGRVFATISQMDGSRAAVWEYKRPG
jgi:hypothetical protein